MTTVRGPAVVNKVDVVKSLVQLLPGVRVACQPSHLTLLLLVEVGVVRVVKVRVEVGWRESPRV